MPAFQVVILDVDGTLVDSNDAHAEAWVEALRHFGYSVPFERVRRLIGMGGDKLVPALIEADDTKVEAIGDWRSRVFQERYLARVRAFPQVPELLRRMRREGLSLVVASSAKEEELGPLLDIAGARDLVEGTTSADDATHSKPDPDIVTAALRRARCRPEDAVMLGDTPYDLEAARQAGVAMVAVRCGGWSEFPGALTVFDDPADLLARYDQSPLAR